MSYLVPVILCGGSGTRLWPLSRESYPKQFVDFGEGKTLFRETVQRSQRLSGSQAPIVVCNESHRFYVSADLCSCGLQAKILLEPGPRNTAPAIALAALALREQGEDPLLLVLPSDHLIEQEDIFRAGVERALPLAEAGRIVTFGISPTGPETGFGYIEQGAELGEGTYAVACFVEKPDRERAQAMLALGRYSWNSGMFLLRASVFLQELARLAPAIHQACAAAWGKQRQDGLFFRPDREAFLAAPADSIDYAIMEKTELAAVVPLHTGWSDLGSWEAFYQAGAKDEAGNVCQGQVLTEEVSGCYLSARNRLLAVIGVHDLVIVDTQDATLVAPRDRAQEVKKIVARLQAEQRPEAQRHPLVYRPWGSYETLALGNRFQVKRIVVDPGAELSLQLHYHRAEHWVVVRGTAEITQGERVQLLTENQSLYIPVGTKHRLKNPGVIPLVLIEIQSGSYLGEDDIVRFADRYGREEAAPGIENR